MNEIQLSDDINVITAEINSYKQIAGQSIWEIGRRLNYVKENDLAHGEFGEWLETVGINHPEANRMMKVAKEIPYSSTLTNLGTTALYLITTLPEEERTKEHTTSKGETKTPDEMTVRELQDLKKQLKAKDDQIHRLSNQKPQTVEKEIVIEKVPDDYEALKQSTKIASEIKSENESLKSEQERLKKKLDESIKALETKRQIENDEMEKMQLKRLQRNADINVHKLIINMNEFVKEQAVTVYDSQAIAGSSEDTKKKLTESIDRVDKLLTQIKQELGGEVTWIIN